MLKRFFTDRKFQIPREWSNRELAKFSPLFTGSVVNASAWKDEDKQGRQYRDYFRNAESYHLTNYKAEVRGYQGADNEIFLDLAGALPPELNERFDCVFNHTTLEHIFEIDAAFGNLCRMSRDAVIIVVPFMQKMHAEYGDFWRFTPTCLEKLFAANGFTPVYTSYNNDLMASVYIFMIAVRDPGRWAGKIASNNDSDGMVPYRARPLFPDPYEHYVGVNAIPSIGFGLISALKSLLRPPRRPDA